MAFMPVYIDGIYASIYWWHLCQYIYIDAKFVINDLISATQKIQCNSHSNVMLMLMCLNLSCMSVNFPCMFVFFVWNMYIFDQCPQPGGGHISPWKEPLIILPCWWRDPLKLTYNRDSSDNIQKFHLGPASSSMTCMLRHWKVASVQGNYLTGNCWNWNGRQTIWSLKNKKNNLVIKK